MLEIFKMFILILCIIIFILMSGGIIIVSWFIQEAKFRAYHNKEKDEDA